MHAVRPFRFGVLAQHVAPSREAWVETARRVEDLGYSTLFVADHLNHPFAPFSALALAGEVTRTHPPSSGREWRILLPRVQVSGTSTSLFSMKRV
jgi:hypothetical protein